MASKTEPYNENFLGGQQSKDGSGRKHQVKKHVFEEIRNVIHNHEITPSTTAQPRNRDKYPNYLLYANVNISQKDSKAISSLNKRKERSSNFPNEVNLLDYFDFRSYCCSKSNKSDQEVWSEIKLYDDTRLNKLIYIDEFYGEEESNVDNLDVTKHWEFFNDAKDESNQNYWSDSKEFNGNSDVYLYLKKPLDINFTF